jgi:hypothetical protein
MATITAAAGGGNWNSGATWTGGVIPTANDDVLLTNTSGNVTINATASCRSIDCTGYPGTLTHDANITLNIGTSTAGPANVACVFSTAMTYAPAVTGAVSIFFNSTVASTVQTIDFGDKTAAGTITLSAATTSGYKLVNTSLNCSSTAFLVLTQGSFDTNNINCTWGVLSSNGTLVRSLEFGTSVLTVSGITIAVYAPTSNITVNASNCTLDVVGIAPGLNLGGGTSWGTITMNNLGVTTLTASGSGTTIKNFSRTRPVGAGNAGLQLNTTFVITGTLTLTGTSAVDRLWVYGQIFIARAFFMGAGSTVVTSYVDYSDIQFSGGGPAITGTSLGDMGNNLNITFDAPVTQYWIGDGGNWSDAAHWSTSSGGTANGRIPLPQDPVIADAASFTLAGQTITMNMSRAGASWNFSAINRAINWTTNNPANVTIHGSVTMSSLMIRATGTGSIVLGGRGSHTVTMAGSSFQGCTISCGTGTYTLLDAFFLGANNLTLAAGTLNTNGMSVGALSFVATNVSNQKTLNMGSSVMTLTGNIANAVWNVVNTATTINPGTGTILITNTGNYIRSFIGAGLSYNIVTFTAAGAPNQLTITGANTFNALNIGPGRQLTMPSGTTNTFSVFNAAGANYGYVYLPGQSGNYASVPSSAALSITGDIDLQCKVALDNWTATNSQAFICKEAAAGAGLRSYRFEIGPAGPGILNLMLSVDGTAQALAFASTPLNLAAGALKWLRVTWRQSDGRVQFFTSDDGSGWLQLGTDQTLVIASIFTNSSPVEVGSRDLGTNFSLAGKVYRAIVKNGINGTVVLDADFSAKSFGANSFIESSSNAATMTINGALAQAGDGRVMLDSSSAATAATVSKSTGYVAGTYLTIKDSTATGGAAWYAGANSVSLTNVTGWNFSSGNSNNTLFMDFFD